MKALTSPGSTPELRQELRVVFSDRLRAVAREAGGDRQSPVTTYLRENRAQEIALVKQLASTGDEQARQKVQRQLLANRKELFSLVKDRLLNADLDRYLSDLNSTDPLRRNPAEQRGRELAEGPPPELAGARRHRLNVQ